ncbi:copper chaperone PCu(A)C [Campylobacter sp. RM16192]|uniref:copper chaperone PCu(A)C n=1 Tax=Campylobacter sp. RM16192 TaxID=1660080 RepID=UPI001451A825|nr:copper chaperone PCu(A)C [Campylobacter sp. RM16192]QCD53124.1 copper-binding protein (DUF461 domain) [Campylobacter sp. RM16192]
MFKKVLLTLSLVGSFCLADMKDIEISNAYAKATPPNVKNSAIFMNIKNNTNKAIKLVGVESSASQVAEIHTHERVDGMMKMIQIDHIEIPAGAEVTLKPGGLHLMLINVSHPIKDGGIVDATLKFDNSMTINLSNILAKHVMKQAHKH